MIPQAPWLGEHAMYIKSIFTDDTCKELIKYAETEEFIRRSWWIPCEEFVKNDDRDNGKVVDDFLFRVIKNLYDRFMVSIIPDTVGVEVWSHSYVADKSLVPWHFDKDECMWVEKGSIICPYVSSIIYLSGDHVDVQGPTCIQKLYPHQSGQIAPASAFIYPHKGSFFTFDGRLYHGVLDSNSREKRITLLINWWQRKPFDIPIYNLHLKPTTYVVSILKDGDGDEHDSSHHHANISKESKPLADTDIKRLFHDNQVDIIVVDHPKYEFYIIESDYASRQLYGTWRTICPDSTDV